MFSHNVICIVPVVLALESLGKCAACFAWNSWDLFGGRTMRTLVSSSCESLSEVSAIGKIPVYVR